MRPTPSAQPRPTTRVVIASAIVATLAIVPLACGTGPDEHSGGDAGRGDAKPAALDTLLYDRVGVDDGDSTDWKSFKLAEASKITINVWWDDPKALAASVDLRDMDAKSVTKLAHKRGEQQETIGPLKLKEGTYFLCFHAASGASVYSYEISTGSNEPTDAVPDL